jgi:hypothetical protein
LRQCVLLLTGVACTVGSVKADTPTRIQGAYKVDVGVLYGLLSLSLSGTVVQEIDLPAKRYRVTLEGKGAGAVHRTESVGILRDGRFLPLESRLSQTIRGRESTVSITYDYANGVVHYHSVSHTLLLGRRRQVDDTLRLPPGQPVDDLPSAYLNFAANKLESDGAGGYRALIVRRAWKENEGPDDVSASSYRAMIAPVRFHVASDAATGGLRGHLDMTSLSSWARPNQPARLTFDAARHLESFQTSLILGTTITVRFAPGA